MSLHRTLALGLAAACALTTGAVAQRSTFTPASDFPIRPLAIAGSPSSARYCVSGTAANVHTLGWVAAGTSYTIRFNSQVGLSTGISRLDLEADQAVVAYGAPDLSFTASSSGTMALFVTGNGAAGCYDFQIQISDPAATASAPLSPPRRLMPSALPKPRKSPIQTMAITGLASSGKQCIAGDGVAKVHALGRVDAGTHVTVTFDSDFDPIAGVANTDVVGQHGTFIVDDDSGGNLDPQLNYTTSQAGTLALFVAGVGGSAGCYHYHVEIDSATPSPSGPLTLAQVAPSLAKTMASAVIAALESPVQGGNTFTATSSLGGSVRVAPVTIASGRYNLAGATVTFTNWQFTVGSRTASVSGSVPNAAGSAYCPGQASCAGAAQPAMPIVWGIGPVTVAYDLSLPTAGSLPVNLDAGTTIGLNGYAVSIGGAGIQTGTPDTPPPPNPNSCLATLSPRSYSAPAGGGSVTVTVTTGATCGWTASSGGFISASGSGRGNGTAHVSVGANSGAARTGSVLIAGTAFTVTQAAGQSGGPWDGLYDLQLDYPSQIGGTARAAGFLRITNGNIRSTDGAFTGTVDANGNTTFTSECGVGVSHPATYTGRFSGSGTARVGSGTFNCVTTPNYTWRASNPH